MFTHLILGLLRDGRQRHGYDLITQYRRRSGIKINPGNLYRELTRLSNAGMVKTGINPPDADARRIPYQITDRGRGEFDRWLVGALTDGEDLQGWLLFADRVPPQDRERILERYREDLWMRNKVLTRAREDAIRGREPGDVYDPLPIVIMRQMKQVAAELEFLDELREHLKAQPFVASDPAPATRSEVPPVQDAVRPRARVLRPRG